MAIGANLVPFSGRRLTGIGAGLRQFTPRGAPTEDKPGTVGKILGGLTWPFWYLQNLTVGGTWGEYAKVLQRLNAKRKSGEKLSAMDKADIAALLVPGATPLKGLVKGLATLDDYEPAHILGIDQWKPKGIAETGATVAATMLADVFLDPATYTAIGLGAKLPLFSKVMKLRSAAKEAQAAGKPLVAAQKFGKAHRLVQAIRAGGAAKPALLSVDVPFTGIRTPIIQGEKAVDWLTKAGAAAQQVPYLRRAVSAFGHGTGIPQFTTKWQAAEGLKRGLGQRGLEAIIGLSQEAKRAGVTAEDWALIGHHAASGDWVRPVQQRVADVAAGLKAPYNIMMPERLRPWVEKYRKIVQEYMTPEGTPILGEALKAKHAEQVAAATGARAKLQELVARTLDKRVRKSMTAESNLLKRLEAMGRQKRGTQRILAAIMRLRSKRAPLEAAIQAGETALPKGVASTLGIRETKKALDEASRLSAIYERAIRESVTDYVPGTLKPTRGVEAMAEHVVDTHPETRNIGRGVPGMSSEAVGSDIQRGMTEFLTPYEVNLIQRSGRTREFPELLGLEGMKRGATEGPAPILEPLTTLQKVMGKFGKKPVARPFIGELFEANPLLASVGRIQQAAHKTAVRGLFRDVLKRTDWSLFSPTELSQAQVESLGFVRAKSGNFEEFAAEQAGRKGFLYLKPEIAEKIQRTVSVAGRANEVKRAMNQIGRLYKELTLLVFPAYYARNALTSHWLMAFWNETTDPRYLWNAAKMHIGRVLEKRQLAGKTLSPRQLRHLEWFNSPSTYRLAGQRASWSDVYRHIQTRGGLQGFAASELAPPGGTLVQAGHRYRKAINWLAGKGEALEDVPRMAIWLDSIDHGATMEQATSRVWQTLYDFSHLTDFERNVMRKVFPFYSWPRFNIPAMAKRAVQQPGKFAVLPKFIRAQYSALGLNDQDRQNLREYMALTTNVPMRYEKGVASYYVLDNWLPEADLLSMFARVSTGGKGGGAWGSFKSLMRYALAQLNPALRVPLEIQYGKKFFSEEPVAPPSRPIKTIGPLKMRGETEAVIKGTVRLAAEFDRYWKAATAGMDAERRQTLAHALLQTLTGVKPQAINMPKARESRIRDLQNTLQSLKGGAKSAARRGDKVNVEELLRRMKATANQIQAAM